MEKYYTFLSLLPLAVFGILGLVFARNLQRLSIMMYKDKNISNSFVNWITKDSYVYFIRALGLVCLVFFSIITVHIF